MELTFRPGRMADLAEICALVQAAIAEMERHGIHQWDARYPDETVLRGDLAAQTMTVGLCGGRIAVIYAVSEECDPAYRTGRWLRPETPWRVLHRLCVHPDFQRRGIARQAVLHAEQALVRCGIGALRMDVFAENPYALRLYGALGYRKAAEVRFRMGRFYLMEKYLE